MMRCFWKGFTKVAAPKWLKMLRNNPKAFKDAPLELLEKDKKGRYAATISKAGVPGYRADTGLTRRLFNDFGKPLKDISYQEHEGLKRKLTHKTPEGTFKQRDALIPTEHTTTRHTTDKPKDVKAFMLKHLKGEAYEAGRYGKNNYRRYRIIGSKKKVPLQHYTETPKIRDYGYSGAQELSDSSKMYAHQGHEEVGNQLTSEIVKSDEKAKRLNKFKSEVPERDVIYGEDTMRRSGKEEAIVPRSSFIKGMKK
jgi:hypothetical protein